MIIGLIRLLTRRPLTCCVAAGLIALCLSRRGGAEEEKASKEAAPSKPALEERRETPLNAKFAAPGPGADIQAQIGDLASVLQKLQQKFGDDHPQVKQAKAQLDELIKALAALDAAGGRQVQFEERRAIESEELDRQLRMRDEQVRAMSEELKAVQRKMMLPPIASGEIKVYSLKHTPAVDAGRQVTSLFGEQAIRVAVDDRSNSLIVLGEREQLALADALLLKLDSQADAGSAERGSTQPVEASPARSLMVLVFWLADGMPGDEGQAAEKFLPKSVLQAVAGLGLENPRLVTQTVNAIIGREKDVQFETTVPAILFGEPTHLYCSGSLELAAGDRTSLALKATVSGGAQCELTGSMAMPLGHFMVLGTANSIAGNQNFGGMGMGRGDRGMMGMGRGGMGMEGGGGFGGEMGMGGEMGAADPEEMGQAGEAISKPKFATSRFAFVVQVIEAESFEPPAYDLYDADKKK